MPGGGPPNVRPLRSGAVTGGKLGGGSVSRWVDGAVGSGAGRATTWGGAGDDGWTRLVSSLVPEGLDPPPRLPRSPAEAGLPGADSATLGVPGSRLFPSVVVRSLRAEGSLEKRPGGRAGTLGPTCGAGTSPGADSGAGGSKMRTRSGVSERTGALVPRNTRKASSAPCRRSERPKVLFRIELLVTTTRSHVLCRIIGKHFTRNKEICHSGPVRYGSSALGAHCSGSLASPPSL